MDGGGGEQRAERETGRDICWGAGGNDDVE